MNVGLSTYAYGGIKNGFSPSIVNIADPVLAKQSNTNHKFTQSPLKRVGALDVLVPQERWHGLRLPEVVLLLDV